MHEIHMDDNKSAEVQYLKTKSKNYLQTLKSSQLSRLQARYAYCCILIPSLRYGLPSFSLTKDEIDPIQKPAVELFLRVMGYEKRFPRAMYLHIKILEV